MFTRLGTALLALVLATAAVADDALRTFLQESLEDLRFDPLSTEVVGVTNATPQRINLDVRRRVAGQAQADAALIASAAACP